MMMVETNKETNKKLLVEILTILQTMKHELALLRIDVDSIKEITKQLIISKYS